MTGAQNGAAAPGGQGQRAVTLGVLGGGQLGRMFVHAAQVHGYRVVVLEPDAASPAGGSAEQQLKAAYLDGEALTLLAQSCHAVTTEFENVPASALRMLAEHCQVAPAAAAVEVCQNRLREKACFARAGVPCAPYARLASAADLANPALLALLPGILKTASMGYDGKGQARVSTLADLQAAWKAMGEVECVLEQRLDLRTEISVILARSGNGQVVNLPVQQNLHRDGILAVTQVPSPDVDAAVQQAAVDWAQQLAQSLSYVGVLCVEFFVLQDGSLVANEMAPRPHNSGHYSIDACDVSQFDLQVRALTGLPLVQPRLHSAAVMLNLLGDLWFDGPSAAPRQPDWARVLTLPGARLHLYGKQEPRRGRKMGHLTLTASTPEQARLQALVAAQRLGLPSF